MRETIIQQLAKQADYCRDLSPLSRAVLEHLEQSFRHKEKWTDRVLTDWAERTFHAWHEAPLFLLAAIHHEVLAGNALELRAYFPSAGGSFEPEDEDSLQVALDIYFAQPRPTLHQILTERSVQTNETSRGVAWRLVGHRLLAPHPFHLVDLGCSAGLNLVADRFDQSYFWFDAKTREPIPSPLSGDLPAILSRTGFDRSPLSIERENDLRWLRSCIWADQPERRERLDQAVAAFQSVAQGAGSPVLHAASFAEMPERIYQSHPATAGEFVLFFNSIATGYLAESAYATLREGLREVCRVRRFRAVWVELERVRTDDDVMNTETEIRVHLSLSGEPWETIRLAACEPHPRNLFLDRSAIDSLADSLRESFAVA